MFNKKSDPLLGSIQKVMNENALRRQLEAKLNEDLGVTSKKAIPHEYHSDYDKALNTEIQHALSEQTVPDTIGAGITHKPPPPKTMSPLKPAPMTGSGSGGTGPQPNAGRPGGVGDSVRSRTPIINVPPAINDPFQGASVNEVTKAVASSLQEKFRKIVKQKMVDAPTDAANDPSRDPDLVGKGATGKSLPDKKKS